MRMKLIVLALLVLLAAPALRAPGAPPATLLVLDKRDQSLAIVDPATLSVLARVPAGPDPHEVVASPDGRLAYISNYGDPGSALHILSRP